MGILKLEWVIPLLLIIIIFARIKIRGFFWKARDGEQLTLKQFCTRYKEGVVNITPLQQTKTTLWSYLPIFAGIIWGVVVTLIGRTYWMSLILGGSLPITSVQFISNIQKYKAQKKAQEAFDEAMGIKPKEKKTKKKKKRRTKKNEKTI